MRFERKANMQPNAINRAELLFIQIFRWILIAALAIILVGAIVLGAKGLLSWPAPARQPEPVKPPPALAVPYEEWLAEQTPPNPAAPPPTQTTSVKEPKADHTQRFTRQLELLWPLVAAYQQACKPPNALTQEQFFESMRLTDWERTLAGRPDDFLASQVQFVKQALESPQTIALCASRKSGLFLSILEFHRRRYDAHTLYVRRFEEAERTRVEKFMSEQERRRTRELADARQTLTFAAFGIGLFVAVVLLLIFSRIEVNLRTIANRQ
jgi:hypothetical protein